MVVYLITNEVNGKVYVGKTVKTMWRRWCDHVSAARRGNIKYSRLYRAMRKYGSLLFSISVLHVVQSHKELNRLERLEIAKRHAQDPQRGYNLTAGGDGSFGYRHAKSTKKILSALASKKIGNKNSFFGKHHTKEALSAMSRLHGGKNHPFFGKKRPAQARALRAYHKRMGHTGWYFDARRGKWYLHTAR